MHLTVEATPRNGGDACAGIIGGRLGLVPGHSESPLHSALRGGRYSSASNSKRRSRRALVGGVIFVVGLAIAWACYSTSHAYYVIAIGPILFGAFRFVHGLMAFGSGRAR